jgi:Na+-driven multidrug efflux pump
VDDQAKDKAQAKRALVILYSVMIAFGILPFVLYWLFLRE